jgi:hypothetical protein
MVAYHVREQILRTCKLNLPDSQDVRGPRPPKRCFRVAHPSDGVEEGERRSRNDVIQKPTLTFRSSPCLRPLATKKAVGLYFSTRF